MLDKTEKTTNENSPNKSPKKPMPTVLKLRFELVDYDGADIEFSEEDKAVLAKYAKMKDGFVREALVPADKSLNALNYMIQRLYGWQNSHLHCFLLPEKTFRAVTKKGDIKAWERLCGVLFRFSSEDFEDIYCADQYDGTQSFKTWLKHKYSDVELPFSISDTYLGNQSQVEEFEKVRPNHEAMRKATTMDELRWAVDLGGTGEDIVERLSLYELLCPVYKKVAVNRWLADIDAEITSKQQLILRYKHLVSEYMDLIGDVTELRAGKITQAMMARIMNQGFRLAGLPASPVEQERLGAEDGLVGGYLETNCRRILSVFEPKIRPLTDTILYQYDYGDGWCVKITCLDGYYARESDAEDDTQAIQTWDFFDCREHKKVVGEDAERLQNVVGKQVPVCIYADGVTVLDDVGGIGGFIEMLKTLHGNDKEEAESMREWAYGQGWQGKAVKVEKML